MKSGDAVKKGDLLLDSEGLSKLYREDEMVMTWVRGARLEGHRIATTTMTILEADCSRIHRARIKWALSRIDIEPITKSVSDTAAELLRSHTLYGHKYAIDAAFAAVARACTGPVTVLTSDPDDLELLCGPDIEVISI